MISRSNGCLWKFISRLNIFLQNKFWAQNKVWEEHSTANVTLYCYEEYLKAEIECVFVTFVTACEIVFSQLVSLVNKPTEQLVQKLISRRISILWKSLNHLCKAWNMYNKNMLLILCLENSLDWQTTGELWVTRLHSLQLGRKLWKFITRWKLLQ